MKTIPCCLCCHVWLNKIWFCKTGGGGSCFSSDLAPLSDSASQLHTVHTIMKSNLPCTVNLLLCVSVCASKGNTHSHTSPHRLNNSQFMLMQQSWWARCPGSLHLWRWEMILSLSYSGLTEPSHLQSDWGREGETNRVPGLHMGVVMTVVDI